MRILLDLGQKYINEHLKKILNNVVANNLLPLSLVTIVSKNVSCIRLNFPSSTVLKSMDEFLLTLMRLPATWSIGEGLGQPLQYFSFVNWSNF